jgi:hypothetical protein
VEEGSGKFGKEREMSLLSRGKRCSGFGNGSHKQFVISEEGKGAAFEEETEMERKAARSSQSKVE